MLKTRYSTYNQLVTDVVKDKKYYSNISQVSRQLFVFALVYFPTNKAAFIFSKPTFRIKF